MNGPDLATLHVAPAEGVEARALASRGSATPISLDDWSPRWRPRPGPIPPILDAPLELDPSFPVDGEILDSGVRSLLWEPLRIGDRFVGGLWVAAASPGAFDPFHQALLEPVAAILCSVLEHRRTVDVERRRSERLERLESLLATLAESLDVRAVFPRLADAVQSILPHHGMALSELEPSTGTFRIVAGAGDVVPSLPEDPVQLGDPARRRRVDGVEVVADVQAELTDASDFERLLKATGMRSFLRVPVVTAGAERGGLGFFHREPGRFGPAEVELARRIADRVALLQSHQLLAERSRLEVEARERALRLEATVESLAAELRSRSEGRVVGSSPAWRGVLRQVERVARAETTVLVTGDSGTGKEVVARLLHAGSPRAERPLVALNCAAIPEHLLESELFGHEKGAFTGASSVRIGRLEQAAGGTLFLDEIGEMSPLLQAKLLRVLQEREYQRVGGSRTLRADVRVVAATHRDLRAAIERGDFREDLYYRLAVFEIAVPPLRERREDILPLVEVFLEDLGRSVGRPAAGVSRDARDWLVAYDWPGNVRELRNAIERAILLCDGGLVTREHLPASVGRVRTAVAPGASRGGPESLDLDRVEKELVEKALAQSRGNRSRAARLLGLTRSQLYTRLSRHGLDG